LEAIYRFALLLTGDAQTASEAVLDILRDAAGHASQFRNDKHRNACLAMKVRELCLKREQAAAAPRAGGAPGRVSQPVGLSRNGAPLATRFHLMPEPQRSALALFYLDLFPPNELAQLFRMKPDGLADALSAGRDFLREHLQGKQFPA